MFFDAYILMDPLFENNGKFYLVPVKMEWSSYIYDESTKQIKITIFTCKSSIESGLLSCNNVALWFGAFSSYNVYRVDSVEYCVFFIPFPKILVSNFHILDYSL